MNTNESEAKIVGLNCTDFKMYQKKDFSRQYNTTEEVMSARDINQDDQSMPRLSLYGTWARQVTNFSIGA